MSTNYWNPRTNTVYGSHDTETTLGSPNIYGDPVVPDPEIIHFAEDPHVITPNGATKSEVFDRVVGTYLGTIPYGQDPPRAGQCWVKLNTGEITQVNVDDIGKGVKAIGDGLAQVGQGIAKSVNHLAWSDEIKYVEENTTPILGHNHASFRPIYMHNDTSANTFEPNVWYHMSGTYEPSLSSGPARTATYSTTSTADSGYVTLKWHVDDMLEPGQAVVWDTENMRMHANYKVPSQKAIDKANKKSLKLLKKWLSPEEYQYLMEDGNLELPSQHEKDTIYIINKDPMKRIGIKKNGKVVEKSLCIHTEHSYAVGDQLLANIMLLKTDEKKFLNVANVHHMFA